MRGNRRRRWRISGNLGEEREKEGKREDGYWTPHMNRKNEMSTWTSGLYQNYGNGYSYKGSRIWLSFLAIKHAVLDDSCWGWVGFGPKKSIGFYVQIFWLRIREQELLILT